ncbi:MAG: prolyl oligopeptidase family serine peptidase [Thermoleophilaceae bacterium]
MRRPLVAVLALAFLAPCTANAANVPVLTPSVPAGGGAITPLRGAHDGTRKVDGNVSDWQGQLPGFGGAEFYSHGELVYEDHLLDAWGPDNGQDAQRFSVEDPLQAAVPESYRIDPALEYAPEEFGIPLGPFTYSTHYGDLDEQEQADLSQVRLGTDSGGNLWLLARTTTMNDAKPATGLLVLLDTKPGSSEHAIGFGSGLKTTKADSALFLFGDKAVVQDLATGQTSALPAGSVATNAAGYDNAVEARIPASLLGGARTPGVAVAAGKPNAAGDGFENVANVAFRTTEPARDYWDKQQALALYAGSIDRFFTTADLAAMNKGRNQRYRPTAGYHDRIFESSPAISSEGGHNGILQHYGLYLPTSYDPNRPNPAQWWFHFRGGRAHIAAAVVPGVIKQMGEDANSVVVTPDGRGSSTWYVGKGQVDFTEVWDDVHKLVSLDRNREYIAGHSMGGWASWLLPVLYPDRFAAAFPASGPPTQGLWAGCEQSWCYQSANDGRPFDEWTTPLLENLRWVPYVNYQGAADELVPVSGVTMQMKKMQDLGLRYRYYVFPHEEHYGPPIFDQWAEGVKYEHQFVRNPNPPTVTLIRSMPMEHAVEEVNADKVPLNFDFNQAFWVSGLEPADAAKGTARVDARSLAIPEDKHDALPDAVPPVSADQTDPSAEVGQMWLPHPGTAPPSKNAFSATLTGARAVRLDLQRMRISPLLPISGEVTTQAPLRLELSAPFRGSVSATVDGAAVAVERVSKGVIAVAVPAGKHELVLR